jgi:hypothetical protein
MNTSVACTIPFNILLAEDEPEILEDLNHEMSQGLATELPLSDASSFISASHSQPSPLIKLECTDNIIDARAAIHSGKIDLLIADYRIKSSKESTNKGTTSIIPLLNEIKNKKAFLPVVGHTAYPDQLELAKQNKLAVETIMKDDYYSLAKVVKRGVEESKAKYYYKQKLSMAFAQLQHAAEMISPIDKQNELELAKDIFSHLLPPDEAPRDYKKALVMLSPFIMRISSVPSERFGLGALSPLLIDMVKPMIHQLLGPFFSFKHHAFEIFHKLESMGYNVRMRVNDETT